jgi:hypothetical protein
MSSRDRGAPHTAIPAVLSPGPGSRSCADRRAGREGHTFSGGQYLEHDRAVMDSRADHLVTRGYQGLEQVPGGCRHLLSTGQESRSRCPLRLFVRDYALQLSYLPSPSGPLYGHGRWLWIRGSFVPCGAGRSPRRRHQRAEEADLFMEVRADRESETCASPGPWPTLRSGSGACWSAGSAADPAELRHIRRDAVLWQWPGDDRDVWARIPGMITGRRAGSCWSRRASPTGGAWAAGPRSGGRTRRLAPPRR